MPAIVLVLLSGLAACSARQGYASVQNWQRNQCIKIIDAQERLKCMREADKSYDQYKKDSGVIKQGQ
ncbi:hypothetical protein [Hydrogenophaga sp. PAMC20947]|uniref:hypothetical protein n=1 Tax=Hydrogenophaga sp. PAMC20947 TaxID=2565558 RepID=UPI00109E15DE|nr:hypothetical protein [Hydrogenophaga sp. PAMC20947]QCB45068.1 hypothetical protein E5678_02895 [Hydrogenophaga sp. PAMC20947]